MLTVAFQINNRPKLQWKVPWKPHLKQIQSLEELAQCKQTSLLGTGYWKSCLVASCQSRKAINSCLPRPNMLMAEKSSPYRYLYWILWLAFWKRKTLILSQFTVSPFSFFRFLIRVSQRVLQSKKSQKLQQPRVHRADLMPSCCQSLV